MRVRPVAGALLALIAMLSAACGSTSATAGPLAGPAGGPRLVYRLAG